MKSDFTSSEFECSGIQTWWGAPLRPSDPMQTFTEADFRKPSGPARQLLTEIMLADRWVWSVARLQRWRTIGEGPQYLKIVGKVLYRLKDIEAYEEACLIRKVF